MKYFVSGLEKLFQPVMGEIRHPRPREALSFALPMVDTTVANTILLEDPGDTSAYRRISDRVLIRETTRAFLAYLEARKRTQRA